MSILSQSVTKTGRRMLSVSVSVSLTKSAPAYKTMGESITGNGATRGSKAVKRSASIESAIEKKERGAPAHAVFLQRRYFAALPRTRSGRAAGAHSRTRMQRSGLGISGGGV